ncbi:hypothetical protein MSTE_04974 [Mycobacteroides stephanolepidis]|uniref:Uncharacterized protein n=1 Tax=[Mycobacterium] stephanolepidis TaxID=1520670 RepID=A0A1Z4F4U3_9MYCO|nr:hypothetical protein MSTE_04974 [[Mycobacterium] stephanolepidis]
MIHGVAAYQHGCRCDVCTYAETARTRDIARTYRQSWKLVNRNVDRRYTNTSSGHGATPSRAYLPWTREEFELAKDRSVPVREVAAQLQRSVGAVSNIRYSRRTWPD